jgi:Lanthionine synthetase C-like protein
MIERARHVPLRLVPWDASDIAAAIEEIVVDAFDHFDNDEFWPAHPLDDLRKGGNSSVYFGASGVIWALDYLWRAGATKSHRDFSPVLPGLLERTRSEMQSFGDYAKHGSLLFGDLGTALLIMRLVPTQAIADIVQTRVNANMDLPVRELMWGLPGSMLACIHMAKMTREARWRTTFEAQAERLLDDLKETAGVPIWTQDLYGRQRQYLGPVHGFAGNVIPLIRGWDWLTEGQCARIADAVARTLSAHAHRSDLGISWRAAVDGENLYCQHCHGAPGMVTTFADAPFTSPEFEELLIGGGKLTWEAGPLAKGSNLCHGTGGNGYAFLKLYRRTKNAVWLEHARAFAVTAVAQCREARDHLGRGRYSLWTGDIGLAVYLWHCLTTAPAFPTVDVF